MHFVSTQDNPYSNQDRQTGYQLLSQPHAESR